MFIRSLAEVGIGGVFTVLLLVAAACDMQWRRIPNNLVFVIALLGMAFEMGTLGVRHGALAGAEGIANGFAIWLPCWWLGMIGAGDVKFFGASAAWLRPGGALGAAIITALVGGLLGVAWLLARSLERHRTTRVPAAPVREGANRASDAGEIGRNKLTLPYGVAMAIGLGVAAWLPIIR